VGPERFQITVFVRFPLKHAAVCGAIKAIELLIKVEENIQFAVLAIICPLVRVVSIGAFKHGGATVAAHVESVTLGTFRVCTSYPGLIFLAAVFTPIHPTTPARLQSI
jgi:hypothetical protein